MGLGRGFTEIARFRVHAINHSPLISAVLFFLPQLPLDRRYSALLKIAGHASCACVFGYSVCLLSWLPIYKFSHVCFIAHAHVVRKCSTRTVSKRIHISFQLRRVDRATRRATVEQVSYRQKSVESESPERL